MHNTSRDLMLNKNRIDHTATESIKYLFSDVNEGLNLLVGGVDFNFIV